MNEKDIIKQLKDSCILDNNCYEVDCLYEKDLEAIRSLLDLYNKAKENIEKFKDDRREMLIEIFDTYDKKNKAEKKLKELKDLYSNEKIRNTIIKKYREVIKEDYISKDKIREKIKKLKIIIEFEEPTDEDCLQYTIDILEELLKGE